LWKKNNENDHYSRDPEERDTKSAALLALIPVSIQLHATNAQQDASTAYQPRPALFVI
jgi:hypothetical protein